MGKRVRVDYVDFFKAVLIISTVIGHCNIPKAAHIINAIHMPAFFMLSVFFFEPCKTRIQLRKGMKSILLYYIISVSVVNIVLYCQHVMLGKKLMIITSLRDLGFLASENVILTGNAAWFLMALFVSKTIFNEIMRFKGAFFVTTAAAVVSVWSYRYIRMPFEIQQALCALPFLYAGYILKKYETVLAESPMNKRTALVTGFAMVFIWFRFAPELPVLSMYECGMNIFTALNAITGIVGFLLVLKSINIPDRGIIRKLIRPVCFTGRNTMAVLCWHSVEQATVPWKEIADAFCMNDYQICLVRVFFNLIPIIILALMRRFKTAYSSEKM